MSTNVTGLEHEITLNSLRQQKSAGNKFVCIALYDSAMAALAAGAGIETIIVGDSLGMTIQGQNSTLPVTIDHMIYHTSAVKRGNQHSLIIADLPFMAYSTVEKALSNAALLMQAGAHMVKLEGGDWLCDTVRKLSERGIPVCAHLGLTPQSVNKIGGYRVQGRSEEQAKKILADAKMLEQAGADMLVLECVPKTLTDTIANKTNILTIGIGAGTATDGQVLVINDLLGITTKAPKFSKNFLENTNSIQKALQNYAIAVKECKFPEEKHSFQ